MSEPNSGNAGKKWPSLGTLLAIPIAYLVSWVRSLCKRIYLLCGGSKVQDSVDTQNEAVSGTLCELSRNDDYPADRVDSSHSISVDLEELDVLIWCPEGAFFLDDIPDLCPGCNRRIIFV